MRCLRDARGRRYRLITTQSLNSCMGLEIPLQPYSTFQESSHWLTPDRPKANRIVSARSDRVCEDPFQTGFLKHPIQAERRMVKRHRELGAFSSRYDRSVIYAIRGAGSVDKVLDILELASSSSSLSVIVYEEALRSTAWFGSKRIKAQKEVRFRSNNNIALERMLKRLNDALSNHPEEFHPSRLWGILRAAGMVRDHYTQYSNSALIQKVIESSVSLLVSGDYSRAVTEFTVSPESWARTLNDLAKSGCSNLTLVETVLAKLRRSINGSFDNEKIGHSLTQSLQLLFQRPEFYESFCEPCMTPIDGNMADRVNFGFPSISLWDKPVSNKPGSFFQADNKGVPVRRFKTWALSLLDDFRSACQRDTVSLRSLEQIFETKRIALLTCADSDICTANKELLIEGFHCLLRYLRCERLPANELRRLANAIGLGARNRASIIIEMNLSSSFLATILDKVFQTYWDHVSKHNFEKMSHDSLRRVAEVTYLCKSVSSAHALLDTCRVLTSKLSNCKMSLDFLSNLAVIWADLAIIGASVFGSRANSELQALGKDITDKLLQLPYYNLHEEHNMWKVLLNMEISGKITQGATSHVAVLESELACRRFREYEEKLSSIIDLHLEDMGHESNSLPFLHPGSDPAEAPSQQEESTTSMKPTSTMTYFQDISTILVALTVLHSKPQHGAGGSLMSLQILQEKLLRFPRRELLKIAERVDSQTFCNFLLVWPELGNAYSIHRKRRTYLDARPQSLAENCLHLRFTPYNIGRGGSWSLQKCLYDVDPRSTAEFRLHNPFLCGLIGCCRIASTAMHASPKVLSEYLEAIQTALKYHTSLMTKERQISLVNSRRLTIWRLVVSLQMTEELLRSAESLGDKQIAECLTEEFLPFVMAGLSSINGSQPGTSQNKLRKNSGMRSFASYTKQDYKNTKTSKTRSTENQRIKLREQVGAPAYALFDGLEESIEHLDNNAEQEEERIDNIWDELSRRTENSNDESDEEKGLESIIEERAHQLDDCEHVAKTTRRKKRAYSWIPFLLDHETNPPHYVLALACTCAQICEIKVILQNSTGITNGPRGNQLSQALSSSATAVLRFMHNWEKHEGDLQSAALNIFYSMKLAMPSHPLTKEGYSIFASALRPQQPIEIHYCSRPVVASEHELEYWLTRSLNILQQDNG